MTRAFTAPHSSVKIEEIAARWVVRRDTADWSEASQAQLDRWLQASSRHRASYIRIRVACAVVDQLRPFEGLPPVGELPDFSSCPNRAAPEGRRRQFLSLQTLVSFAVGVLLGVSVGLAMWRGG